MCVAIPIGTIFFNINVRGGKFTCLQGMRRYSCDGLVRSLHACEMDAFRQLCCAAARSGGVQRDGAGVHVFPSRRWGVGATHEALSGGIKLPPFNSHAISP